MSIKGTKGSVQFEITRIPLPMTPSDWELKIPPPLAMSPLVTLETLVALGIPESIFLGMTEKPDGTIG